VTGEAVLEQSETQADKKKVTKYNHKYEMITTKQRGSWYGTDISPVLSTAGQKLARYYPGHYKFFTVFQNICLLKPRFLAVLQRVVCGTLVGKNFFSHCAASTLG
jgi:hypothetical protein